MKWLLGRTGPQPDLRHAMTVCLTSLQPPQGFSKAACMMAATMNHEKMIGATEILYPVAMVAACSSLERYLRSVQFLVARFGCVACFEHAYILSLQRHDESSLGSSQPIGNSRAVFHALQPAILL